MQVSSTELFVCLFFFSSKIWIIDAWLCMAHSLFIVFTYKPDKVTVNFLQIEINLGSLGLKCIVQCKKWVQMLKNP